MSNSIKRHWLGLIDKFKSKDEQGGVKPQLTRMVEAFAVAAEREEVDGFGKSYTSSMDVLDDHADDEREPVAKESRRRPSKVGLTSQSKGRDKSNSQGTDLLSRDLAKLQLDDNVMLSSREAYLSSRGPTKPRSDGEHKPTSRETDLPPKDLNLPRAESKDKPNSQETDLPFKEDLAHLEIVVSCLDILNDLCEANPNPSYEVQCDLRATLRKLPNFISKRGFAANPERAHAFLVALNERDEATRWGAFTEVHELAEQLKAMNKFQKRAMAEPVEKEPSVWEV